MMHKRKLAVLAAIAALAGATAVMAGPRDDILAGYAAEAGVTAFDTAAGEALFTGTHAGGKPETPSCTTCHTNNLTGPGKTRAGKTIEPMAVSANPQRFTDPAKVEKWFGRNCRSVLGRECSAKEKGDVITWLSSL
jgi:mono/diheme cytochrome c family protein